MFDEQFEVQVHGKYGVIPMRMEDGSVGYDIAMPDGVCDLYLPYNSRRCIDTGIIIKPPIKCFELIVPRSSSRKKGVRISNTVGVIDPSYSGQQDTIRVDITREPKKTFFVGVFPCSKRISSTERILPYQGIGSFSAHLSLENLHDFQAWCEDREVNPNQVETCFDPSLGEVHVFESGPPEYKIYSAGERFCQVLFLPYYRPDLLEAKLGEFADDNRGGFGSTGA